ncbi:hypothetical protein [Halocalculus aciditolerans]|nr:hypothetical protein [Halocalculus aciditolerans]
MVTGLYGALAASASVFIGILTALLTSKLTSLSSERNRIDRRVRAIDARLRGLRDRKERLNEKLENIEEMWEDQEQREKAEEQVEDFIENYVGDEFQEDPDEVEPMEVHGAFADFLGVDIADLNDFHTEQLQERYEDVLNKLQPTGGLFQPAQLPDVPVDAEVQAAYDQIDHQWQIHNREQYNQNERQWIQTNTEIRGLRRERQKLVDRFNAIDTAQLWGTLRASAVAIILTVFVPLLMYLLRETELTFIPAPVAVEAVLVFVIWALGLGYVLYHIRAQISDEDSTEGLPDEPDIG